MTLALEAPESVAADLGRMPPCTHTESHAIGKYGHVPEQSAAFLCGAPCGITWFACAGWVETALRWDGIQCENCGWHILGAHTFVPLGELGVG